MGDNPTPPPPPQVKSPAVQSRRPRKKNTANKDKAESIIQGDAKMKSMDKLFSGFQPDTHGNITIELEPRTPERFALGLQPFIENYQNINFIYPGNAEPVATVYHVISAGLNIAMAIKLMNATPQSQLSDLQEIRSFSDSSVDVPSSFNHVLNLIGKTDFQDSAIRIQDNPSLIKVLFTKAVWHLSKTPPFDHQPVYADPDISPGLNRLSQKRDDVLVNTVFSDMSTVHKIRRIGRECFERNLKVTHRVELPDNVVHYYSPPWLSSDADIGQILEWMNRVDPATPGFNDLLLMSIMSKFEPSWIRHIRRPLNELNPIFIGSPIAAATPDDLLALAGLTHYSDYFRNDFAEIISVAISLYNAQIPVLSRIFNMTTMSRSTFGDPAQLVTVPPENMRHYIGIDIGNEHVSNMTVMKAGSTTIRCNRKLTTPSVVLASAAFSITKSVHFNDSNTGHSSISLTEILNRFISDDARAVKNQT